MDGGSISQTAWDSWRGTIREAEKATASIRPPGASAGGARATVSSRRVSQAGTPPRAGAEADYRIESLIGAGGMGLIYRARQASLNRAVALKTLSEKDADKPSSRSHLESEALIAGQLDHPNIVPVHDLAMDERGRLFYTMKHVGGTAWSRTLPAQPLEERLAIFQRVCDAVAFAHSRGVIHRDLKPDNIMLGAFGEVTVMDWGVACTVRGVDDPEALGDRLALCGTPAYMAPEMARGDGWAVGFHSDIYLLGAILYEILEGRPPRGEPDALACVRAAADNAVDPPGRDDELTRVALKALSADPADRHGSVRELQDAVRRCQAHLESVRLARAADDTLREAEAKGDYARYARSVFSFEESLALWPGNRPASEGLSRARRAYARRARERNDFELALSQLDPADPAHAEERAAAETGLAEDRRRRGRLRLFVRVSIGLAATVALGVGVFNAVVRRKNLALQAQQAEIARQLDEVRRSEREGLTALIERHHAAGAHEEAVATAARLREAHAFDWAAHPELRRMARISAWMNPWRAVLEPGVRNPIRLILNEHSPDLYLVGEDEIAVVDPERLAVRRRIPLPSPSINAELVQVGAGGEIWCARGMDLHRFQGAEWVLFETVPEPADSHSPQISGLGLGPRGGRVAVAINSSWLASRSISAGEAWETVLAPERHRLQDKRQAGCMIRVSSDEHWIAWHPNQNLSWIRVASTSPLRAAAEFSNRHVPILNSGFLPDSSAFLAVTWQGLLFRPDMQEWIPGLHQQWAPERHNQWASPLGDAAAAAWSPDRSAVVVTDGRGGLWTGGAWPGRGRQHTVHTMLREVRSLALDDHGQAYALTGEGRILRYDLRTFSRRAVAKDEPNPDRATGDQAARYLEERNRRWGLAEAGADGRSPWRDLEIPPAHAVPNITLDPRGEYVIYWTASGTWALNLADGRRRNLWPAAGTTANPDNVAFSPDGEWLAVGASWGNRLTILRRDTWEPTLSTILPSNSVGLLPWPGNGRMNLVVGGNSEVLCYDMENGTLAWRSPVRAAHMRMLIPVPPGAHEEEPSLWAGDFHGKFIRMALDDGRVLDETPAWWGHLSRLNLRSSTPPGLPYCAFWVPERDGLVLIWNGDMHPVSTDLLEGGDCLDLRFSPRGSTLVAVREKDNLEIPLPRPDDFPRIAGALRRVFGDDAPDARLVFPEPADRPEPD